MGKLEKLKSTLEWAGHFETIRAIITLALPTMTAAATGALGLIGGAPLMWVVMAVSVAFGSAAIGILSASTYLERKNPAYKLTVTRTLFNFELVPIAAPNRNHRRAATAQGGVPAIPAFRHFTKGQLGFEVWNRSSYPLSLQIISADTEIRTLTPKRGKFPKPPIVIQPGTMMWVHDDTIALEGMICENLDGKMDIVLKYGYPNKENYEIRHHGTVEIFMEPFGQLKGLYFHPASETTTPG